MNPNGQTTGGAGTVLGVANSGNVGAVPGAPAASAAGVGVGVPGVGAGVPGVGTPAVGAATTGAAAGATSVANAAPKSDIGALMEEELTKNIAAVTPTAAEAPVAPEKPKKNMGMIIGMVVAGVVAVIGIVFGVMMMVQKNSAAADYDKQITQLKKINSELMAAAETATPEVDTADYIYVGEWGIKIQVPAGLKGNLGYMFNGSALLVTDNANTVTLTITRSAELEVIEGEEVEVPDVIILGEYYYNVDLTGVEGADLAAWEGLLRGDSYSAIYETGEEEE